MSNKFITVFCNIFGCICVQRSETKGKAGAHRKERLPSTIEDESFGNIDGGNQQQQRLSGVLSSAVASGIKESVVFSGNIANKLPSDNDNGKQMKSYIYKNYICIYFCSSSW